MYYRFLLAVLPLPVIVFLNSAVAPNVGGTFGTIIFSVLLGLVSVGAFLDIAIDSKRVNPDENE